MNEQLLIMDYMTPTLVGGYMRDQLKLALSLMSLNGQMKVLVQKIETQKAI